MSKQFYDPKESKFGYMYHVEIIYEALLTYAQVSEIKNGGVYSIDPNDHFDYNRLEWRNCGSVSFAEKEWNDAIRHIRGTLKSQGKAFIAGEENNEEYIYFTGYVIGLDKKVLKRARVYVTHETLIEYDQKKFNKHLTKIGKGE